MKCKLLYDNYKPCINYEYRLNDNEITPEEMAEIMNAVSDDDLEVQRALAETYRQRRQHD